MRLAGDADAYYEARLYGGRADVFSPKANWIAKCGNTGITKLIDAIYDRSRPRFTLVPYQTPGLHYPDEIWTRRSACTQHRPCRAVSA